MNPLKSLQRGQLNHKRVFLINDLKTTANEVEQLAPVIKPDNLKIHKLKGKE